MKRTFYFLKNYKYDFIASVFLIGSAIFGYYTRNNQQISFYISIGIIIASLIVIIYLRIKDRSFYFIPFTNRKDKNDCGQAKV